MSFLVVFGGVLLLVSAWVGMRAHLDARRYFPPQFSGELSSRSYMSFIQFDQAIPLKIRRQLAVSSVLAIAAFVAFAFVAYLSGNPVIAVLLLLICGYAVANIVWQWRHTRG